MCRFFSRLPGHTAQACWSSDTKKRGLLRASATVGPPSALSASASDSLSSSWSSEAPLPLSSLSPASLSPSPSSRGLFRFRLGLSEPLDSLPDGDTRRSLVSLSLSLSVSFNPKSSLTSGVRPSLCSCSLFSIRRRARLNIFLDFRFRGRRQRPIGCLAKHSVAATSDARHPRKPVLWQGFCGLGVNKGSKEYYTFKQRVVLRKVRLEATFPLLPLKTLDIVVVVYDYMNGFYFTTR